MGLLFDLETRLEQELPLRLQGNPQESLDQYRPRCSPCGLVMHRHHRYSRPIAARYGVLDLRIPVFRCEGCCSMTSGAELLGDGERYRRYQKTADWAVRLAALGLSYAQAGRLVGSVKSTLCRWVRRETLKAPVRSGQVWELDGMWTRTRSGSQGMRVIRDERGNDLGSFKPCSEVIDQAWGRLRALRLTW